MTDHELTTADADALYEEAVRARAEVKVLRASLKDANDMLELYIRAAIEKCGEPGCDNPSVHCAGHLHLDKPKEV
jgi:hypothetical protein